MRELGFCNGIENYSRYFDRREPGQRPFCLLDYFSDDFLLVVDESHVTVPQVGAMYGGDRSRKVNAGGAWISTALGFGQPPIDVGGVRRAWCTKSSMSAPPLQITS